MASEEADGIIIHAGVLTKQLAFVLGKEAYPHLIIDKPVSNIKIFGSGFWMQ